MSRQQPDTRKQDEDSPADLGSPGLATKYWINPHYLTSSFHPWRKVDIEFHNSKHIPKVGDRFDADEFGDRLVEAHVNGAVIFAKDMFGYSYYPSAYAPIHPGLAFDLFGAQVTALRKRKIMVYAYYMTTWNLELGERHPEWLALKRDRTSRLPKSNETPGCSQETGVCVTSELCLSHEDFVNLEINHIRELVSRYELDALWIDGAHGSQTHSPECYCDECIRQLEGRGLDPLDTGAQYTHQIALQNSFVKKIHDVVKEVRPNCQVGPQNEASFGLRDRVPFIDYSDLEGLFTDTTWYGYFYAPTILRFARNFGLPTYGLTTRFEGFWGDFGGLKLPNQLLLEMATFLANGARCDIGDQIHPNGRLDPAVYQVIGEVYRHVEKLEPYLDQAIPVTELALITSGRLLDTPCTPTNFGWVKLLTESHVQFDIVDSTADWERYAMVILPDELVVEKSLASRLHAFVERGGAVIVAHNSGLLAESNISWLELYGFHYDGASPFIPAYLVPQDGLVEELPSYEYALYEGASQWSVEQPATTLALLGEPLFQRSPEHYTSHAQTPFDHTTQYAAVALSGRIALFAFPLGRSYFNHGYWIYRQIFQNVLKKLLPSPLVQTNAPLSAEVTLTRQAPRPEFGRAERYMVHIVNYSPLRQAPKAPVFCEDPIPLTNLAVRLNLPVNFGVVKAVFGEVDLLASRAPGGGLEVVIPKVPIYEVLSFEKL
ncbi:MAG: beta-galactosidase trimerization domain-containing protein [Thaumarchaeota archaeon]|nr:beta-galactosidase trimerization domain-containing protein [Nitrososphaerota archaeon]